MNKTLSTHTQFGRRNTLRPRHLVAAGVLALTSVVAHAGTADIMVKQCAFASADTVKSRLIAKSHLTAAHLFLRQGNTAQAIDHLDSAATCGSADAAFQLADLLEKGIGLEKDKDRAMTLYEVAADRGHAEAKYRFALLLLGQNPSGYELEKAMDYLREAAATNQPVAKEAKRALWALEARVPPSVVAAYRLVTG